MTIFKKFFVGVLLIFGLCGSLWAEDSCTTKNTKRDILSRYSMAENSEEIFLYMDMNEKFEGTLEISNINNSSIFVTANKRFNNSPMTRFKYYFYKNYAAKFLESDSEMYQEFVENTDATKEMVRKKSEDVLDKFNDLVSIVGTVKGGMKDIGHVNYVQKSLVNGGSTELLKKQAVYLGKEKAISTIKGEAEGFAVDTLTDNSILGRVLKRCYKAISGWDEFVGCTGETTGQFALSIGDIYAGSKNLVNIRKSGAAKVARIYLYIYYMVDGNSYLLNTFLRDNLDFNDSEFYDLEEQLDAIAKFLWNKNFEIGGEVQYNFETARDYINDYKIITNDLTKGFLNSYSSFIIADGEIQKSCFPDVSEDYWAKPYIDILFSKGIIKGYSDGEFKPKREVSIGEFLLMSTKALLYDKYEEKISEYQKVDNIDFSNYVEFLHKYLKLDIEYEKINDYSNGSLNIPATRGYIAKILTRILNYGNEKISYQRLDGDWDSYSDFLNQKGISNGKKDTQHPGYHKYAPNDNITRDEISVMISKSIDIRNEIVPKSQLRKKYSFTFSDDEIEVVVLSDTHEQLYPKWKPRLGEGNIFSTYQGIDAYEGLENMKGSYQCTDLIKRFYQKIFNMPITSNGNGKDVAKNIVNNSNNYTLSFNGKEIKLYYLLNNISTEHPSNGSVISFDQNGNGVGHVAIAKKVICDSNQTKCETYLFEQNYVYSNKMAFSRKAIFTKDTNGKWSGIVDNHSVIGWTIAKYIKD